MQSKQPDVYAAVGITLGAATVALVLRLIARRTTHVPLWWDDYMCMIAYLFGVAFAGVMLAWTQTGLGLHINDVDMDYSDLLPISLFYCFLVELLYAASLAFSKFAILAFYWRMFSTSPIKMPIIIIAVASLLWLLVRTLVCIFHCLPVQAFWDKSITDATCTVNDSTFFFSTVLAHLVLDLGILSLPIVQVRRLQLRTAQKIGVIALFMFGILVCAASIVVLVYSKSYDPLSPDLTWDIAPIMIWASVEVNLAIFSACIPMLRPIFLKVVNRLFPNLSVGSDQYHASGPKSFLKMTATRTAKSKNVDTESMVQLADLDSRSFEEHEPHAIGGFRGLRVTVTGNARDSAMKTRKQTPGILVRSETSVQVSENKE
ncbi:hypothetical protein BX600DRAFT_432961 [Xylariales sp. PMI_506]|nr:hypothetical protein BX600DRAFT_432961 [Xylariales sp. PMI_506]